MILRVAAILAVTTFAFAAAASADPATAPAGPVRHLVYDFTYSNSQTQTAHDSGISSSDVASTASLGAGSGGSLAAAAPNSGMAQSSAATSDRGQITVDVVRVQPDGGLVVSISEQAHDKRSALPATCVVYGNTNVICDSSKRVNTEELSLLRLLGSNFIDVAQIDVKNHWRVDQSGPSNSDVADYSISANQSGVMKISSQRVLKESGAQAFTATTDGTIYYDAQRLVPTSLVEDEMLRQNGGMGTYSEVRTQTSLQLVSDSAKKP